ncbi:MAG: hypothetical protein AB1453_03895 [Chloroflexota bacterium]
MKVRLILVILMVILPLAAMLVTPVMAQSGEPPVPEQDVNQLLVSFLSLAGVGALISALVNVGKTIGWVKDGQAPVVVTGLNLVGMVALFALRLVRPDFDIGAADDLAQGIAQVLTVVLGFVIQLGSSRLTHAAVKNVPIVGKSYSTFDEHSIRSYG